MKNIEKEMIHSVEDIQQYTVLFNALTPTHYTIKNKIHFIAYVNKTKLQKGIREHTFV